MGSDDVGISFVVSFVTPSTSDVSSVPVRGGGSGGGGNSDFFPSPDSLIGDFLVPALEEVPRFVNFIPFFFFPFVIAVWEGWRRRRRRRMRRGRVGDIRKGG